MSYLSTVRGFSHGLDFWEHQTLLHAKYIYGFREEFLSFSQNKSMGAIDSWGVASFDSRA